MLWPFWWQEARIRFQKGEPKQERKKGTGSQVEAGWWWVGPEPNAAWAPAAGPRGPDPSGLYHASDWEGGL